MSSNATNGEGALLKIGNGLNGASSSYTAIAEAKDFDWQMTRSVHDVSSHSSGGWKEKKPGLKDPGTVSFEMNFLPQDATQSYSAGLMMDYVQDNFRDFEIVWTDPGVTTWKFSAYVKDYQPKGPVDGVLTAKITLEVSGAPTLA